MNVNVLFGLSIKVRFNRVLISDFAIFLLGIFLNEGGIIPRQFTEDADALNKIGALPLNQKLEH